MSVKDLSDAIRNWKFTKDRIVNLSIGIVAVSIYQFIARPIYRPYIYRNDINDFHLADTIGNTLGTIAAIYISIGLLGQEKIQRLSLIRSVTIIVIVYEFMQPLLGKPIDPWDIVATIITGGTCFILYKSIHSITLNKSNK